MKTTHRTILPALFLFLGASAWAQRAPHIGYVYPAGGQQGGEFEATIGGQYLNGVDDLVVSGPGIRATIVKHIKPLTNKQQNELRNMLRELKKKNEQARKKGKGFVRPDLKPFQEYGERLGIEITTARDLFKIREKFFKKKKSQLNPQLSETVKLKIKVHENAKPGPREIRLNTTGGLTNPLHFHVGTLREHAEKEPNDKTPDIGIGGKLPVTINGQIMPGDVDRFRFRAQKGDRIVLAASARELMPYLADAVPGWFQATLALYDEDGREVAYADDFRFKPDPVLYVEIPESGSYELEIKDSIYRGRQDFVYRITVGQVPYVTGIFPLGGPAGTETTAQVTGWNLNAHRLPMSPGENHVGVHQVSIKHAVNHMPFAVDALPECPEKEPNNERSDAQTVNYPMIVNGRIDRPGDLDVFRIAGKKGDHIVAETMARRLESPVDSLLKLLDKDGKLVSANDDYVDKGAGLTTHHADSRILATLPADGTYYIQLADTQNKGGDVYAYRLRISPPQPDFELRVAPCTINARAGSTLPITVYALRKDGFDGDIEISLKGEWQGFKLSGGWVPAGQEKARMTLTAPMSGKDKPFELKIKGVATINGKQVVRTAVPAEDMMQAFIYRHLVPAKDFLVTIQGNRKFGKPLQLAASGPVKLALGGSTKVQFDSPRFTPVNQITLELSDPPEGITMKNLSTIRGGVAIQLSVDKEKVKPGLKGNLIINAFMQRSSKGKSTKPQRGPKKFPIGSLPAIPFEIVGI